MTIGAMSQQYSGEFDEVALENAKQELIGMFPYVKLMGWTTGGTGNIPTGFVAKFRVPHTISSALKFRVLTYMTVFEVPRSIARSLEKNATTYLLTLTCSSVQSA